MSAARKLNIKDLEVRKPQGWQPHHDGRCPVLPETVVSVRWRNGETARHTYEARQLRWERFPRGETPFDIVAFKISDSPE